MHTTLEAFLREAIEEILRRKGSDMMGRMGERGPIYPSLMCGVAKAMPIPCQSQKWTGKSGDVPGWMSRLKMERVDALSSCNNYRFLSRLQIKHQLSRFSKKMAATDSLQFAQIIADLQTLQNAVSPLPDLSLPHPHMSPPLHILTLIYGRIPMQP
jgi:hypothetical protein